MTQDTGKHRTTIPIRGPLPLRQNVKFPWLLACILVGLIPAPVANAGENTGLRLRLADPFIELRSGPGRSFPVYEVVERGERIEILRRRTDWYEIRASRKRRGWTHRSELEATLEKAGLQPSLRDRIVEKYLKDKFYFGASGGTFDGEGLVTIRGGYMLSEHLALEGTVSNATGLYAGSNLFQANLLLDIHVFGDWRPFFLLGASRFTRVPEVQDVSGNVVIGNRHNLDMANAGLGLQYFLTKGFSLRTEVVQHATLRGANRSDRFTEWTAGITFFF